ncbi:MAG: hypothetical protein K9M82_07410 [Deltaproteobacteria bacterium]|nr:hypothetical protein [Deltaproteobacteria bacterium]
MYAIEAGDLIMHLEVVRVETLREHEETLRHVADTLALEFKNWAHLHNPIIVDQNHIVLDGNHRTFVFKRLGFRTIPVCKIDYYSEHVGLRYWFRLLKGVRGLEGLSRVVEEMEGSLELVTDRPSLAARLEQNPLFMGVELGETRAVLRFPVERVYDGVAAYEALERMQKRMVREGAELEYVPCQTLAGKASCEKPDENTLAIWTPHITKDMVVQAASCGKVFAPKATRHLVAARPINVNVPVRWFREDASLEEMNERFAAFLRNKQIRRFGPGQVINGRYYGEEIFVFYDRKTSRPDQQ